MYFQIYKVNDYEKLITVVVSLEGEALNWYRGLEERELFNNWRDLKIRLLEWFHVAQQGSVLGLFLAVK